jgi:hypothetical protein
MLSPKRAGRGRKALTATVLVLFGPMLVGWAVAKWRSFSRSPERSDLMATVKPDDEFWLSWRLPGTHVWEKRLLPRDQAVVVLRVMETAQPWEPDGSSGFSCSSRHVDPPGMKGMLVWCKDWNDRRGLQGNTLWIHYRNELINYDGKGYVVTAEGHEILDRLFPPEDKSAALGAGGLQRANLAEMGCGFFGER